MAGYRLARRMQSPITRFRAPGRVTVSAGSEPGPPTARARTPGCSRARQHVPATTRSRASQHDCDLLHFSPARPTALAAGVPILCDAPGSDPPKLSRTPRAWARSANIAEAPGRYRRMSARTRRVTHAMTGTCLRTVPAMPLRTGAIRGLRRKSARTCCWQPSTRPLSERTCANSSPEVRRRLTRRVTGRRRRSSGSRSRSYPVH